jgi:hypothetical protein
MSDEKALIDRLREMANDKNKGRYSIGEYWNVCDEAADEIERLRAMADDKKTCRYSICDKDPVIAARRARAWNALRRLNLCRCDLHEYCEHCYPLEFRHGGIWHL